MSCKYILSVCGLFFYSHIFLNRGFHCNVVEFINLFLFQVKHILPICTTWDRDPILLILKILHLNMYNCWLLKNYLLSHWAVMPAGSPNECLFLSSLFPTNGQCLYSKPTVYIITALWKLLIFGRASPYDFNSALAILSSLYFHKIVTFRWSNTFFRFTIYKRAYGEISPSCLSSLSSLFRSSHT